MQKQQLLTAWWNTSSKSSGSKNNTTPRQVGPTWTPYAPTSINRSYSVMPMTKAPEPRSKRKSRKSQHQCHHGCGAPVPPRVARARAAFAAERPFPRLDFLVRTVATAATAGGAKGLCKSLPVGVGNRPHGTLLSRGTGNNRNIGERARPLQCANECFLHIVAP